jgi:outer membrane protein
MNKNLLECVSFPMRRCRHRALAVISISIFAVGAAHAEGSPWSVRVGPAGVYFNTSASVDVAGSHVPGAEVNVENKKTLGFDIGYDLSDRWTLHLAGGIPPRTKITTGGALNSMVPPLTGKLADAKCGPGALTAVYKFNPQGNFNPYIGAGVSYTFFYDIKGGDISGLNIDSSFGAVVHAGFTAPITQDRRWSYFFDVRKVWVETHARGTIPALGDLPARVTLHLDPLVALTGVEYHF